MGSHWIAKLGMDTRSSITAKKRTTLLLLVLCFMTGKVNAELEQQIRNIETAKNDPDIQAFIRQKEEERNKTYDIKTERIKNKFGKLI